MRFSAGVEMKRNEWKRLVFYNRVDLIIELLIFLIKLTVIVFCSVILFPVYVAIGPIGILISEYHLSDFFDKEDKLKIIKIFYLPFYFCWLILLYPIIVRDAIIYDMISSYSKRRTVRIQLRIKNPPPPVEIMELSVEYPHIFNKFMDITFKLHKVSPPFRKVPRKWSSGYDIVGNEENYEWTVKFPLEVWVNNGIKILSRNEDCLEDGCEESERINFFVNLFHEGIRQGNFYLEDMRAILAHLKISEQEFEAIFDALAPLMWEILLTKDVRQVI